MWPARADEVGVQGVDRKIILDRPSGGNQGLPSYLTTECALQ